MSDQAGHLREMAEMRAPSRPGARVIAITSGKGGVGKTNLAVNLGIALARRGLAAGLLDADLGLANVDLILGVVPEYNLSHVLHGERSLTEVLAEGPAGLWILAGGSGVYELANLSQWRLELFVRSLRELDDRLEVLLIDTGAGIGRNVLSFVLASTEVIVVTTPEPTAIADAYGMVKVVATRSPQTRLHLVVNLAPTAKDAEAVCRRLNMVTRRYLKTELEYLGHVPQDHLVARSVQEQQPFILSYPHSPAARRVDALAELLVGGAAPARSSVSEFFQRMARFLRPSS